MPVCWKYQIKKNTLGSPIANKRVQEEFPHLANDISMLKVVWLASKDQVETENSQDESWKVIFI